jgi:dimeric dUTPase (all-alpha-NTP-PPase superfamily)
MNFVINRARGGKSLNWDKLFAMQFDLDEYIKKNHQLENDTFFEEKFLALLVELGELANETRCFKYWSMKKSSDREIVLEEYVDNIHFILSLGIEKQYQFSNVTVKPSNLTKTKQFNKVFLKAIQFYETQTEENYIQMVESYLQLANLLGFTENDIFAAYIEKNEVNYERQKSGY